MRHLRISFLLTSLFFLFENSTAQSLLTADTLQQVMLVKGDSNRLKSLVNLAELFLNKNQNDLGIKTLQAARESFNTKTPLTLTSKFYWILGEIYYKAKNYTLFEQTADTLIKLNENNSDRLWLIKGLHQKAFSLIHQSNLTEAANLLNEAIDMSIAIGNKYYEAKGYQAIGSIAFQGRQITEVKKQYQRAIEIYRKNNFEVEAALLACSMSRTYVAELTLNIDSAFYWNNLAKPTATTHPDNLELNYFIWQNEADYYSRSGDLINAEKAFAKAEEVANRMPSKYSLGGLLQVRSLAAYNNGKLVEAINLANRSKDIFIEMGDYPMLKKSYQLLYIVNEEKGDYKSAFESLNNYIDISDSVFTQQSIAQINDLNVKYETTTKEKKIAEQELAITRKNSRLKMLIISLAAIAVALLLLFMFYMQRRKTYQQSLITLKKEQDISLLKALMTGEEKERNRLARELHDGLGGILAAAQMQVSNLEIVNSESQQNNKQKATELVSKAATESRRIAHNLLPETLLRFGLDEALKEYSASITESKLLNLSYESVGMDARMEQSTELSIYRIIQELINNIVKHAGATEALVQLHRHRAVLSVTVEDNGNGFSPGTAKKDGIGLSNIQSRISYLNGSMDIRSEEKKGTSVFIEIQLEKNVVA